MHQEEAALMKQQYEALEEIGRGKFGTVFRCFHPSSNQFYALKVIDNGLLSDATDRHCLEVEAKAMTFLSPHPNILEIIDTFQDAQTSTIVLPLCQPRTLFEHIADGPLPESHAASLAKQLLEALTHCHALGVAHRDIKPENLLFDEADNLKLSDFGFAEWFGEGRTMSGLVGSPYYVAPEVLMGKDYDEKVDVWSSGVTLYAMLSGIPPFYGDSTEEIFEAVLRSNLRFPTTNFRSVSSSAKDLLRKMICRDPSRRISAHQALNHPWILSADLS
ncbi:hypothetical protein ACSQ67_012254 [Phaseolus vulgaris]